jgi:bifunctional non-homologous end joining protein LigD
LILGVPPSTKSAPFPDFIEPCLATLRTKVPVGVGFVHEVKLDGYRVQAHVRDGRVTLYTRSGFDWTNRFATISADVAHLPAAKAVLDGEIICADPDGRPNFSALQDDLKRGATTVSSTTPLTCCTMMATTRAVRR